MILFSGKHWVSIAVVFCLFGAVPAHAIEPVLLSNGCGTGNLSGPGIAYPTVDSQGRLCISAAFAYANVTSNATTTLKSGAGLLHSITINTKGATSNTATIYDNTAGSGTKIGTIDTTAGTQCLSENKFDPVNHS